MNRLAIHESAAADLSPTQLVDVAALAGFDSVGLKVAHSPGADRWWTKGAGSAELPSMVEHLLINRVSVLDVGRIELGGTANAEPYRGVLDLASRFGARFVTASGVPSASQVTGIPEQFGKLVADCDDYQLIPLLIAVPGTGLTTTAAALDVVRSVGGGVVITASTGLSAFEIETQVLDAGNQLGYLRLLAEEIDAITEDAAAGLLATVPVHVPIAVGSLASPPIASTPVTSPPVTSPPVTSSLVTSPPVASTRDGRWPMSDPDVADLTSRAHRWSTLIDRMLEHPLARAHRLSAQSSTAQ
jgi:hypothetical protein